MFPDITWFVNIIKLNIAENQSDVFDKLSLGDKEAGFATHKLLTLTTSLNFENSVMYSEILGIFNAFNYIICSVNKQPLHNVLQW